MASPCISDELWKAIHELGQRSPRLSNRQIAAALDCSDTTVLKYRNRPFEAAKAPEPIAVPSVEPAAHDALRKALKKSPLTVAEIANELDCSPRRAAEIVEALKAKGAMLHEGQDGRYSILDSIVLPPGEGEAQGEDGEWTHRFGFTTDNHLCNKHSRLDVLKKAYEHFAQEGITRVFNAGNWIDGEARFNRTELLTAPGVDRQLDYLIDNWPVHPGITTDYIAGDDHEGWYQQREGIEIGRYLENRANDQGRHDLKYLGYGEADVKLSYGLGSAVMRVVHPGGGSAYAISYTDQKRVESYQGGEKPQIELVGHYHKFNHGFPREVHTVQGGCTCDQTMFMRKKRIQAHVGYSIIKIKQDAAGIVTRFAVEWFSFFDRGFYEKRF